MTAFRLQFIKIGGILLLLSTLIAGCTDEPPDTSAPERIEIIRGDGWQDALLYIADENGPEEGWGSIRIYDNVSGFVEASVEQTGAAAPSDMFVTPDGSSMYVASGANGAIEKWRWTGNSWIDGNVTIETPAASLSALVPGPDGRLYATQAQPALAEGAIHVIDYNADRLANATVTIPGLSSVDGIAWSQDGSTAFITGTGPGGPSLFQLAWPAKTLIATSPLPIKRAHELVLSPNGRYLYVCASGDIIMLDSATGAIVKTLNPGPEADEDYFDAAFSGDGGFMFVTGSTPANGGNLYVIDLATNSVVKTVKHVGAKANGIQRVE